MVLEVLRRLRQEFGTFKTELTYRNPFELTIAVILSAQCTDARVNLTTPALFKAYPTPEALAAAKPEEVEPYVKSCGFFRMKAKNIVGCSRALVRDHGGEVPRTLDELVKLDGVGRKTASVVLNQAYDIPAIAVDTHVKRVAGLLGWTAHSDPVKVEFDLRELVPKRHWAAINGLLILHGRKTCRARRPRCGECQLEDLCPGSLA